MDNLLLLGISLVSIFQSMNMGASGIAVSFSAAYGSKVIKWIPILIIFTFFVGAGAFLIGENVAKTFSSKLVDKEILDYKNIFLILLVDSIVLFVANILKVPASTSICLVFSYLGVGLYYGKVFFETFGILIAVWILSLLISYFLTYFLMKLFYPPRKFNLVFYQKFLNKRNFLVPFIIVVSCYQSFGIGANNVANVVAPLSSIFGFNLSYGFLFFSLIFAIGAVAFGKGIIQTIGNEVVPIGIFSASIVSIVSATISVVSSLLGLPVPIALYTFASIVAVATVKNEFSHLYSIKSNPIVRKIIIVWIFSILSPVVLGFGLAWLFNVVFLFK